MKIRDKNEGLKGLIQEMNSQDRPIWKAFAKALNRPNRISYQLNLFRLERNAKGKQIIAVPGAVLGSGEVTKAYTVAAVKFSDSAKAKLEKAGGKCMTLKELFKSNPEGKGIRIMG